MSTFKNSLLLPAFATLAINAGAQTIASFTPVTPAAQTQNFVIPSTHTFQQIIRNGTALTLGGAMGANADFTGYVPIAGSSTNGFLSISSETAPAEIAVLSITFNPLSKLWAINNSGKVSLPSNEIGLCAAFCSGTVTPRNTIMVCEEVTNSVDINADGYEDLGWIVEIDPATRTVINQDGIGGADKLWAMGRQTHENVTIAADQTVAYWGADNTTNGFLYKFVPAVPGNFSAGNLYVLETTGLGTGTWKQVSNTTKAERNNTISASVTAGAYNFNRIEDVELGPDGKLYLTSTATGRIFRLTDAGTTVSNLEVFVDKTLFDVGGTPVQFEWPDNLAFDGEGNLWVLQDGGQNHIWVVDPTHTAASPAIRVFANTPTGSEPTGITFSPDFNFLFISLQHPSGSNSTPQADATGSDVVFSTHTTLVIARKENLGNGSVLPLKFVDLQVKNNSNSITLNWSVTGQTLPATYVVERSVDGVQFSQIGIVSTQTDPRNSLLTFTDKALPPATTGYYRIKACDANSQCLYSEVKSARIHTANSWIKIYPTPVKDNLQVTLNQAFTGNVAIKIFNAEGRQVYQLNNKYFGAGDKLSIPVTGLSNGSYTLQVNYNGLTRSEQFIKN
ncbi:MAG: DUF839 domain-containing protein [Chitinophagaceae bacterium]|nr:DUF839 domain-containing protein [Chitinophagaceae bacterium]